MNATTLRLLITIMLATTALSANGQVSLDDYRREVVDYSHSVATSEAATDGAEADMRIARKGYLPSLDMSRDATYAFRDRGAVRQLDWVMRADISQPIFYGGGVRASAKRAEEWYRSSQSDEESVMLSVVYSAEVAYWQLSEAETYLRAISDYRDIVSSLREVVVRRFDEGYTAKGDLLQVESRLSDAEYQLSKARQRWLQALHNFNVMRGYAPTLEVTLVESILDTLDMPSRADIETLIARHPDYMAAEANLSASRWGVKVVRSDYLPRIGAGVYGLWQPASPNVKGAGTRLDGGVAISMSTPIYHFGERREAMRSARSAQRRSELKVEEVRDRITLGESDAWTNLVSTRERVDAVRRNLSLAAENLDISTYSYHEGLATILDVLQAQLSWLQIYQNAIAALSDYALALSAYRYISADSLIE